jgi:hypothetical protein
MSPSAISPPLTPSKSIAHDGLKNMNSPLPKVETFHADTVTVDELVNSLKVAGGCVIRGMLKQDELDRIEKDVRPWLDKDKPWEGGKYNRAAYLLNQHDCHPDV